MVRTARRTALAALLAVLLLLGLAEVGGAAGAVPADLIDAPTALVAGDVGEDAVAPRLTATVAIIAAALVLVLPALRPASTTIAAPARPRPQRWWTPPPGRAPPLRSSR